MVFMALRLVGVTGVEPVTSSLSGTRSNQLSYTPGVSGLPGRSSHRGHRPLLRFRYPGTKPGGGNRGRTGDPKLAKLVLYQLSYAPGCHRRLSGISGPYAMLNSGAL